MFLPKVFKRPTATVWAFFIFGLPRPLGSKRKMPNAASKSLKIRFVKFAQVQ